MDPNTGFLLFCTVVLLLGVEIRARPAHSSAVGLGDGLKPASCMTKWLSLSTGVSDMNAAARIEEVLLIHPQRVDEATSTNITAINLDFLLGGLSHARSFLDCMNKRTPNCRHEAPCRNGGQCMLNQQGSVSGEAEYGCSCVAGYSGMYCELNITSCNPNPCQNGGTCRVLAEEGRHQGYGCTCTGFYSGRHCETKWLEEARLMDLETAVLRLSSELQEVKTDASLSRQNLMEHIQTFLRNLGDQVRSDNRQLNTSVMARLSLADDLRTEVLDLRAEVRDLRSRVDNHPSEHIPTARNTIIPTTPMTTPATPSTVNACNRGSGGESGVFMADIAGSSYTAYCDRGTDGGGWTVFQRRQDGSVNFDRLWVDYQRGFGSASGEFWLGLDTIHQLTSQPGMDYELRVDITFTDTGEKHYEKFSRVRVADSGDNYRLNVTGQYSPTVRRRRGMSYNNGRQFTTRDRDNDGWSSDNCAVSYGGPWWHGSCSVVYLNGVYGIPFPRGLTWYNGRHIKVQFSEMKVRPVE